MTKMRKISKLVILIFMALVGLQVSVLAEYKSDQSTTLTEKQQSIIPIAAFTAQGELEQLKPALNAGLEAGLTVNEIKEIMVHLYAYCGFPRSIRGLQTFMEVMDERKAKGITDETGVEASLLNDERSKYDRGKANLETLIGRPLDGPQSGYAAFAPIIEIFLKEHLFADIFDRDVLTYAERELVTVSVISAIGSAEPMLRSHLSICLNVGYTPDQLQEFVSIIQATVGKDEAKAAQVVLNEVLKNR
ncbi:Carboxymuconolactone decarboxylase family protein [Draconibacterium orientale]|uniref:Carboxymuconolactone decarboxylase family protein n=3 Tax=Draconibacterium orientale TaxID=1168034 RepID=A0A1H9Y6V8_9BACT|nr:Carboxymuconolactone decarboxylase family protein [Draconibacterium orientale]